MVKKRNILIGVTGSIAAYKSADIIRRLMDKGFKVTVIMTEKAKQFITPLTLSSLSRGKVYCDMFDRNNGTWDMDHVSLADDASALLIAPATANVIGKIAGGIADDLLTCLAMTVKAPILIAPAMNEAMFKNKIVQENCQKLKRNGMKFISPTKGKLACGVVGEGHIASVEDIVQEVMRSLK